jgi:hypothetical protein
MNRACAKGLLMSEGDVPNELAGRWRGGVVLKRDVFSTI